MKIQLNRDKNIRVNTELTDSIREQVRTATGQFQRNLTLVEVPLSGVSSNKTVKNDKRCSIEAISAGERPLLATMSAATVDSAVRGSLAKLRRVFERDFGPKSSKGPILVKGASRPASRQALSKILDVKRPKLAAMPRRKSPVSVNIDTFDFVE